MSPTPEQFQSLRTARGILRAMTLADLSPYQLAVLMEVPGKDRETVGRIAHKLAIKRNTIQVSLHTLASLGLVRINYMPAPGGGHPRWNASMTAAGATYLQHFAATITPLP